MTGNGGARRSHRGAFGVGGDRAADRYDRYRRVHPLMNPKRRNRLVIVLFLLSGAAVSVALALSALSDNLNLFYPPDQIVSRGGSDRTTPSASADWSKKARCAASPARSPCISS